MNSSIQGHGVSASYGATARALHWLVAGMIVVQFVLAKLAENAEHGDETIRQLGLLANHKSVGITIFAVALLRLCWRVINPPPALPATMPRWQITASHLSHWSLYLLIFALPITGWLMSSATAYSVSWFNFFQLPDLIGADAELEHTLEEIHETLAKVLLVIASLHILAAVKHVVIDKDGVMQRMTSLAGLLVFVGVIAAGVLMLGQAGAARSENDDPTKILPGKIQGQAAQKTSAVELKESTLSVWQIDYDKSFIRFTADQAGADFTGEWPSWQAALQFSEDLLDDSQFEVTINTQVVDTQDQERDDALADADWFDSENFPFATYRATNFSRNANGSFVANGELTVKGQSYPVDLLFTVSEIAGRRSLNGHGMATLLEGNTQLDRLQLRLGTGEWEDTTWVGQMVRVEVRVEAPVQ